MLLINSDARNKEVALRRIRQLASAGLPVEPLIRSTLELIGEAVPTSIHRAVHIGGDSAHAHICVGGVDEILALHSHYFVESPLGTSGARYIINLNFLLNVLPSKTIWRQEDIFLPDFHRAEGFNEAYRPLGWNHAIGVVFHETGKYEGYYGMWRTAAQKPFSREDVVFLRAIAPHVTHGLKLAQRQTRTATEPENFTSLNGWIPGVLLLDNLGKPTAMDSTATMIFQQLGLLDGVGANAFAAKSIRQAFAYIATILHSIFHKPDGSALLAPPVYRLYQHWSGIVLSLRGALMIGGDDREYINVLIERGETLDGRRKRLIARWGLSQREAEVLSLIGENKTGPEIALILRISHDTARKHTSRILEKLGLETRLAAAEIARTIAPSDLKPIDKKYSPSSA